MIAAINTALHVLGLLALGAMISLHGATFIKWVWRRLRGRKEAPDGGGVDVAIDVTVDCGLVRFGMSHKGKAMTIWIPPVAARRIVVSLEDAARRAESGGRRVH